MIEPPSTYLSAGDWFILPAICVYLLLPVLCREVCTYDTANVALIAGRSAWLLWRKHLPAQHPWEIVYSSRLSLGGCTRPS